MPLASTASVPRRQQIRMRLHPATDDVFDAFPA
jgi:hypothetical protein